ncbi:MAG: hypothetical protein K6U04_13595, partial [Armatimonadetes bacterium]|nr:hypothetical protein [Armatimonadota bacterium]
GVEHGLLPALSRDGGLLHRASCLPARTVREVTEELCRSVDRKPGAIWWVALLLSAAAFAVGLAAIWEAILVGMGVWGINRTVGWGFDITNFVFWIGIGHAGTMISAVLFLFRQEWRTAINRAAEAMTVFAVACAAVYPLVHMGRPWFFYWLVPYPNNRGPLWANFRSPLLWDFSAILTYFTISFVFWYVGMLPDLATLRDRARAGWQRSLFGFLALGWNGSARDWNRYESIYAFLALLAANHPAVGMSHVVLVERGGDPRVIELGPRGLWQELLGGSRRAAFGDLMPLGAFSAGQGEVKSTEKQVIYPAIWLLYPAHFIGK